MITDREVALLDDDARSLLTLLQQEQHASLLNEVDERSRHGPLTPGVLGVAALALTALERYDEAVKAAGQALTQQPAWAWLHSAQAEAFSRERQFAHAVVAQRRAAQLMPGEPAYTAGLARYLRETGQVEQAARTARQALLTHPEHAGALGELGLALQAGGDVAAALAAFRQARSADPSDPAAYMNEGALHLRAGARKEARQSFREALRRRPGLTHAENQLAETYTGPRGVLHAAAMHILNLGRVTLVGWLMIAFIYYVTFRVLQILWRYVPTTLPIARGLLLVTLSWLLGGLLAGRVLRWAMASRQSRRESLQR